MRSSLFQVNGVKKEPLVLPEAQGQPTTLTEKVFVPVREHPDVSNHCHSYVIYNYTLNYMCVCVRAFINTCQIVGVVKSRERLKLLILFFFCACEITDDR